MKIPKHTIKKIFTRCIMGIQSRYAQNGWKYEEVITEEIEATEREIMNLLFSEKE